MPRLGKGTEWVLLLLSQVSKDMHQSLVSILFPILGAHVSGAEFMYSDKSSKETSGILAKIFSPEGFSKPKSNSLKRIHPRIGTCRSFVA